MTIHYIYTIVNSVNGKKYVGYTSKNPPRKRWEKHVSDIFRLDRPLYRAFRKYDIKNFKFEVVYCSKCKDHTLHVMEEYFIKQKRSYILEHGYNLTFGGESNYGWCPSNETRELWSTQRTGKLLTSEHKIHISDGLKRMYANNPKRIEQLREYAIKNNIKPPKITKEGALKSAISRTGKHIHTEKHKKHLSKLFKQDNHPLKSKHVMEKRQKTWKEIGRNIGAKNPQAVFCDIYNPEKNLIASGYLRDICEKYNFPFNKFLKAQRHGNPLQRGKWKGWKIIKI